MVLRIWSYCIYVILVFKTGLSTDTCATSNFEDKKCEQGDRHDNLYSESSNNIFSDILVYTVATNETDGLTRYLKSAKKFDIEPNILGWGQKWKGGENIKSSPGGGWKINLLKSVLGRHAEETDKIVLFTDAYDVIFLGELEEILRRFKSTNARVLFGAEPFCWPNIELAAQYPKLEGEGKRFLNSGIYMGYIPELLNILNKRQVRDTDDDQLFFTEAYLDEEFRAKNMIKLDHRSQIFQNLHGVEETTEILTVKNKDASTEDYYLKNREYNTQPLIVHGNGNSKLALNYLSNYLPSGTWNSVDGCVACLEDTIDLSQRSEKSWPVVFLAVFIEMNTPFIEAFFEKIHKLEYPKDKIHLFIHNSMKYHSIHVKNFTEKYGSDYLSLKQITPEDGSSEWAARDLSLDQCLLKKCDYYFMVDSIAHLDNSATLKLLIEQNRGIVAPLLMRPGKAWSNFWGSLTKEGFYARSNDYMDIVHGERRGLWNVPFINTAYLINSTLLKKYDRSKLNYDKANIDPDMAFCSNLRDLQVFMYVSNRVKFGHLVNADTFDIGRAEPDMYQIFDNEQDWEEAYIHPEYQDNFNPDRTPMQPCPDVYWFPIVTPKFASSLINMMENYGKWSSGRNDDERLEGGYEAVPTRDIHMNQVGWETHWLHFLQKYVRPLQELVFIGYFHDPPKSLMNFVVRYRPDEQPSLRPHHDSSTYTINIALNRAGIDYEGGGCRFIRYDCSVTDTKLGWLLLHPGKLTHYHEGLKVTNGTRYIMIAFVDP